LSDWLGPKLTYYPKKLEKYARNFPLYDPKILARAGDENLEIFCENAERRVEVINQMMEELDWNLFWIIYSESDGICHRCYEDLMEGHKDVLKIFRVIDKTFEKANGLADLTLVVSDHGFYKYDYVFNINVFLEKLNLITKTRKRTQHWTASTILADLKSQLDTCPSPQNYTHFLPSNPSNKR